MTAVEMRAANRPGQRLAPIASIAVIAMVPALFVLIALDADWIAVAAVLAIGGLAAYYLRRTRLGRIRP